MRGPVWERNDEHETVATPPYGYEVLLDQDTRVPAAVIAAPFLEVLDDGLTWPQRPAGSAALLPPALAPAPQTNCADHRERPGPDPVCVLALDKSEILPIVALHLAPG